MLKVSQSINCGELYHTVFNGQNVTLDQIYLKPGGNAKKHWRWIDIYVKPPPEVPLKPVKRYEFDHLYKLHLYCRTEGV